MRCCAVQGLLLVFLPVLLGKGEMLFLMQLFVQMVQH
ncbi:putative membrane protein [Neisseria meningitidis 2005172]|nr:putative membrane protein [Neisseria meningitidis 96060]EOC48274.1 putative membrane protein [Neisseria meningitidis 2005172]